MIKENKVSKYILYAIGEIALVMIGILLALQVNNWNEQKKLDIVERKTLINLKNEFEANLRHLKNIKNVREDLVSTVELLLKNVGPNSKWNGDYNIDSLLGIALISGYKFIPASGVLTDVLNSDKINLISNDSLRYLITSIPSNVALIGAEDDQHRKDMHGYFLPFVGKHYPTKNFTKHLNQIGVNFTIEGSRFKSNPEKLLNNVEFESILNTEFIFFKFMIEEYGWLEYNYNVILQIINEELTTSS